MIQRIDIQGGQMTFGQRIELGRIITDKEDVYKRQANICSSPTAICFWVCEHWLSAEPYACLLYTSFDFRMGPLDHSHSGTGERERGAQCYHDEDDNHPVSYTHLRLIVYNVQRDHIGLVKVLSLDLNPRC